MSSFRVLVIDDDTNILETYRHALGGKSEDQGLHALRLFKAKGETAEQVCGETFELTAVSQGMDGVAAVARGLTEGCHYAVAFVDMRMPPGIDGLETAKRIRALDEEVHIIVVTAFSDRSVNEIHASLEHDVVFVYKPVASEELLQLARNACHSWNTRLVDRRALNEFKVNMNHVIDPIDFTDILWMVSDGVMYCNHGGIIQSVNPSCVRMLKAPPPIILFRYFYEFFEDVDRQILNRLTYTRVVKGVLANLLDYDGNKCPVRLNIIRMSDYQDKHSKLVVMFDEVGNL